MIIIVNNLENGVLKIMSWNWLGWLSWICAIAFFCYVIHYIRVKQLMLIAKTKKVFKLNLVAIEVATSTPAEPDTTPQTSPTTSLQIDANLSEFFKSFTE